MLRNTTVLKERVYARESQNNPWRDRGSVTVLLTHRDELGEGDHLFAFSDGVEK